MRATDKRDPTAIATLPQQPDALRRTTAHNDAPDAELLPAEACALVVGDDGDARSAMAAEIDRLRAELLRVRGDDDPASPAQLRFLADLLRNGIGKRDAAATISYLKGWARWSKPQQSLAVRLLSDLPPRDALDLLQATANGSEVRR